jgi:hypothetical protein
MVAYTPRLAEIICQRLADGESLRKICLDADMPNRSTVFDWLDKIDGFQAAYDKAHERQGHLMAGLALEAALEPGDPTDRRLRWDALRWHAGKLAPKQWSDKSKVELSGELNLTSGVADRLGAARQRLAAIATDDAAPVTHTPLLEDS